MSVVKANAYGMARWNVRAPEAEGSDWFAWRFRKRELRLEMRESPTILCLAGFWGGHSECLHRPNLVPVVTASTDRSNSIARTRARHRRRCPRKIDPAWTPWSAFRRSPGLCGSAEEFRMFGSTV